MKLSIDRFEGGLAVCEAEDRSIMHIALDKLPEGTQEGDLIELYGDGNIILLTNETNLLREQTAQRLKRLAQKQE